MLYGFDLLSQGKEMLRVEAEELLFLFEYTALQFAFFSFYFMIKLLKLFFQVPQ